MSTINYEKYGALLFDLDGTLADTMPIHNEAWIETLKHYNCPMSSEILLQYAGMPNPKTIEIFNQRFNWNLDPIQIAYEKDERFFKNLHKAQAIIPVLEVAQKYYQKKPLAIVSGGTRKMVTKIISTLKIDNLFSELVCAEDVEKSKPNPDPFLMAAKTLNVNAKDCLVFEDGDAGIKGALAANMEVVKITRNNLNFELFLLPSTR